MAETHNTVVATYAKHEGAEAAIRKVGEAGLDLGRFTIVGRASHVEERVTGLRQTGDRVGFWAECGTLWGGVSGLPIGGLMVDLPEVGPVLVVGHMAMAVAVAITGGMDGAVLGVLGAALAGIGVPHPSILECREALAGDAFLVIGHGTSAEVEWARALLRVTGPARLSVHTGGRTLTPIAA